LGAVRGRHTSRAPSGQKKRPSNCTLRLRPTKRLIRRFRAARQASFRCRDRGLLPPADRRRVRLRSPTTRFFCRPAARWQRSETSSASSIDCSASRDRQPLAVQPAKCLIHRFNHRRRQTQRRLIEHQEFWGRSSKARAHRQHLAARRRTWCRPRWLAPLLQFREDFVDAFRAWSPVAAPCHAAGVAPSRKIVLDALLHEQAASPPATAQGPLRTIAKRALATDLLARETRIDPECTGIRPGDRVEKRWFLPPPLEPSSATTRPSGNLKRNVGYPRSGRRSAPLDARSLSKGAFMSRVRPNQPRSACGRRQRPWRRECRDRPRSRLDRRWTLARGCRGRSPCPDGTPSRGSRAT